MRAVKKRCLNYTMEEACSQYTLSGKERAKNVSLYVYYKAELLILQ